MSIIIYSTLLVINVTLTNLQENRKKNIYHNSLASLHESNDYYDQLNSNKLIGDVKRVVYFDNLEDKTGRYYFLLDPKIDNRVLVYEDRSLKDDFIDIYLCKKDYSNIENTPYQEDTLSFSFNDTEEEFSFNINKLYKSKHVNSIAVSSKIFAKLLKLNDGYDYTFKLYESETNIKKNIKNVRILTSYTEDEMLISHRINQYITVLIIFDVMMFIIFIIIIFIISNNLINDLNKNINLEYLLGFNNLQISNNILVRLVLLNISSIIIAIIGSFIILSLFKIFIKIDYFLINYYLLGIMIIILIIENMYVVIKSFRRLR